MKLDDILVIDTETTGKDPSDKNTRVIQLGIVRCSSEHHTKGSQVPNSNYSYLNPGDSILELMSPDLIAYHGITPDFIKRHGKNSKEVLKDLDKRINPNTDIIAGHNLSFDLEVLYNEFKNYDLIADFLTVPTIDTYRVVQEWYELGDYDKDNHVLPDFKLGTCFYGILPSSWWDITSRVHDAESDSLMCSKLIEYWVLENNIPIEELVEISAKTFIPKRCPIGDDKGKLWEEVSTSFLSWMVKKEVWNGDTGLELAILSELEKRKQI